MIGDRYGSPYLPSIIPKNEFELIKSEISADQKQFFYDKFNFKIENILEFCYELDLTSKTNDSYQLLDVYLIFKMNKFEV